MVKDARRHAGGRESARAAWVAASRWRSAAAAPPGPTRRRPLPGRNNVWQRAGTEMRRNGQVGLRGPREHRGGARFGRCRDPARPAIVRPAGGDSRSSPPTLKAGAKHCKRVGPENDPRAERHSIRWRHHDDDGISADACAVIRRHGLDRDKVLDIAGRYKVVANADFNSAPYLDFENAPLGSNLVKLADREPGFDPLRDKFANALDSLDYKTSDGLLDKCLMDGILVGTAGKDLYDCWRQHAVRLEGLNVALFRAASRATRLYRFIKDVGELDNYLHGRWRRDGDMQDRVPTTVGRSNYLLGRIAIARVSYRTAALKGWIQPVRYSPYPRTPDTSRERFGDEKSGNLAGEGEVHVHTDCPIPPRKYVNITLRPPWDQRRQEVVERYGDAGIVD